MSVTTSQVEKIMRGGVWGRNITSCVIGLALVGLIVTCVFIAMGGVAGQTVSIGRYHFPRAALEAWPARLYVAATMTTFGAMAIASLYLIRGVFSDLALGNIFGSNSFNMILFVPLDIAHRSPLFASLSQTHVLTALAVIMATAIAVLGQLYKVEKRTWMIDPDALLVIAVILASLALIYYVR